MIAIPTMTGDWKKAEKRYQMLPTILQKNLDIATKQNALIVKGKMKRGIVKGRPGWEPNAPSTIKAKGSSKPLIDEGDLMGAIVVIKLAPGTYFVGIIRTVRNKNGDLLVNIARVHEYGVTIARGGYNTIIPPRPFVYPTLEESKIICHRNFFRAIRAGVKGKLYVN